MPKEYTDHMLHFLGGNMNICTLCATYTDTHEAHTLHSEMHSVLHISQCTIQCN